MNEDYEKKLIYKQEYIDTCKLIAKLCYSKDAVKACLENSSTLCDMKGITYWAGVVEKTRKELLEKL